MNAKFVTCSMCGHNFDPAEHATCSSCPLHQGCAMICCPACGYSTIDPNRSRLVQWISMFTKMDSNHDKSTTQ